ncbi:MAG: DUF6179 domain-containing protein, partial [Oscillospiraceae bacterium]|nr:DUF6179 domain-containing protein [Oscillospiraceae bacterium]
MTYKTNPGENKSLSETYAIKTGDMNESAYFLSLTENALGAGLLTEADIADMQRQIYAILAENIRIGTNGKSTSVASAKAGELMESILYVLDCFCLHKTAANTDEKALNGLVETFKKKAAIGDCYREGKKLLDLGQEIYKKPENILDGFELPAEVLKELLELDQKMEIDKKIVSQS